MNKLCISGILLLAGCSSQDAFITRVSDCYAEFGQGKVYYIDSVYNDIFMTDPSYSLLGNRIKAKDIDFSIGCGNKEMTDSLEKAFKHNGIEVTRGEYKGRFYVQPVKESR